MVTVIRWIKQAAVIYARVSSSDNPVKYNCACCP
jgi:predicted site-specific integrase-resolvase